MTRLLVLALGLLATAVPRVELPTPEVPLPPDGYDLRYQAQLEALAATVAPTLVRVEATRTLPPPFDPEHPAREDGCGVVLRPGRLVTTARYVQGADGVRLVRRNGVAVKATVARLDAEAGFALVDYPAEAAPELKPVAGFAGLPPLAPYAAPAPPGVEGGAAEVVLPTNLTGSLPGLRVAAALREGPDLYLSGLTANGVPAFDRRARVVALSRRPAPDRSRTVAVEGDRVAAWLAKAGGP